MVLLAEHYELLRRVGHGGMGQVWEALDTLLGRRVAVKTVLLEDSTDAELSARVFREPSATAQLSHPDIVTVHDAGMDEEAPAGPTAFIVMELLEGMNLRDLLAERGTLPLGEALRIGADVASALAASHEIGVVHRDIKPANILVDGRRVTVVDFGIAALTRSADPTIVRPGSTLGTAAYMAPEQAASQPVGPASDVYSLGCVLFTLLSGEPPFSGAHFLAVLQQHAFEPPPLLSERCNAPDAVTDFLDRMLAKDPAVRPSATEVAETLTYLAAVHDPADDVATPPSAPSPGVPSPGALSPQSPSAASPSLRVASPTPPGRSPPCPQPGRQQPCLLPLRPRPCRPPRRRPPRPGPPHRRRRPRIQRPVPRTPR